MTRKHFKAIAESLKFSKPVRSGSTVDYAGRINQWEHDVSTMADMCFEANDNFDRDKFLTACGVE